MHQTFNLLKPTGYVMHQTFNLLKPTGYVMHQTFNLLKPTGYVMHQDFNLLKHTAHVMHQHFNSEQKLGTRNIKTLVGDLQFLQRCSWGSIPSVVGSCLFHSSVFAD
jgi:hypothetical protein